MLGQFPSKTVYDKRMKRTLIKLGTFRLFSRILTVQRAGHWSVGMGGMVTPSDKNMNE